MLSTELRVKERVAEIVNEIWTGDPAQHTEQALLGQQVVLMAGIVALLEELVSAEDAR